MNHRGGPPTTLGAELAAAAALARAREIHGAPPPAETSPSVPPEPEREPARPAHDPKHCRSCGRAILWALVLEDDRRTVKLKAGTERPAAMPVDFQPDPVKGNVVVLDRGGTVVAYTLKKGEAPPTGARLRTSHFSDCPNAHRHRRKPR
jgi:hypothetical protein